MEKINFLRYGEGITDFWQPYEVAHVGNMALRIAKIRGTYDWHVHKDEDEFFYVLAGSVHVDTESESVTLEKGEGYLVKGGVKHRSRAFEEAIILLIEPIKTKTKGEEKD